jgi:hypothetical protein
MDQQQNPALVALSRVLEDASRSSGTSAHEILVQKLELRARTEDPTPLPPVFFITLGNGSDYLVDTQGNILQGAGDRTDRELRVRFTQAGGFGGGSSTYEADDSTLSADEVNALRRHLEITDFSIFPTRCLTAIRFRICTPTPSGSHTVAATGKCERMTAPVRISVQPWRS